VVKRGEGRGRRLRQQLPKWSFKILAHTHTWQRRPRREKTEEN